MTKQPVLSALGTSDTLTAEETVRFIAELSTPTDDQRSHERTSIRRPVTLYVDNATRPIPALLRDITIKGVGLLHDFPIKPGEFILRIPNGSDGDAFCARVNLLWCQETARSVYMSGGSFMCVFVDDPLDLPE